MTENEGISPKDGSPAEARHARLFALIQARRGLDPDPQSPAGSTLSRFAAPASNTPRKLLPQERHALGIDPSFGR